MLTAAPLSAETLASIFAQSVDCVKLVDLDGNLLWMNAHGQRAMEIDDFAALKGTSWSGLWPEETRPLIEDMLAQALEGRTMRFDAACPTAKGAPRWWGVTISTVADIAGRKVGFMAISRDATAAHTARQALEIGSAELRHRLRNTYAIVGALMSGFARGNAEHEAFAHDMQERLITLSIAQSLFTTDTAPCDLARLVPALVDPFASPACAVTIAAPANILVGQDQANAIALVIGELCVNSVKHGAAASSGTIGITVSAQEDRCQIIWAERGARLIGDRDRPGAQGLRLIARIVQARGGTLHIGWQSHGPTVTIGFPVLADEPA
ncbi:MAG TPA: PAS domain-containing protein [Sphingobium sp.]|nr:PAS domain-containing protein [Sphingobium sp.]